MTRIFALILTLLLFAPQASASSHRSAAVRLAYLKTLGLKRTPVGCQVDHLKPLSLGGADAISNMVLLCGPVLQTKEKAERHQDTLDVWKQQCLPKEKP